MKRPPVIAILIAAGILAAPLVAAAYYAMACQLWWFAGILAGGILILILETIAEIRETRRR